MDPVNGLSKIIELLKQRAGEAPAAKSKFSPNAHRLDHRAATGTEKLSKDALRIQITQAIRELSASRDPKAARQVFLSSVLAWEFGPEILQDAGFADLIHEVEKMIDDEPDLAARFDDLLQELS